MSVLPLSLPPLPAGVYADVDVRSKRSLAHWLPPKDNAAKGLPLAAKYDSDLTWDSCSMLIGLENDVHFCQWTIAGVARHPVLEAVLKLIVVKALAVGEIDTKDIEFVHQHSGPGVWTDAIIGYLENRTSIGSLPNATFNSRAVFNAVYSDEGLYKEVRDLGICLVGKEFMGSVNVKNEYGSQKAMRNQQTGHVDSGWQGWGSWVEERMVLRGSKDPWSRKRH